jgi:toxin ParE1/3/4
MTKPVILRLDAQHDERIAMERYLREDAPHAVKDFVRELLLAYDYIGQYPATGSLRYAERLRRPGLRCRSLERFPFLIFYTEHPEYILVWHVLHRQRDIPTSMQDDF